MARRLIFKEGGLTGSVPSGYQAVGFNGLTFSQLTSGGLFTSGGSGASGTSGVNGTSGTSAAGGGLTNFTESLSTSAPNATVNVVSLTATASTTNVDFVIIPKGTGAILAAIPDGTATGGNKRGAGAVDLQTARTNGNQVASGNYAFVAGNGNRSEGSYASIPGGYNNIATGAFGCFSGGGNNSSTGNTSFTFGQSNTASAGTSFALGTTCISSGGNSFAMGQGAGASGQWSFSLGNGTTANADYSFAMGYWAHCFGILGRQSYSSGPESTYGDSQKSLFVLRERTTNATATTLTTNSSAASTNNQVILSNQSSYRFKGTIIGKKSGTTDAACWDVDGLITRGANAASTTLNSSTVTLVSNTPAWGGPTLAADTTNGGLQIQVVGTASTNIQWTATIETTEVIYS